MMYTVTGFGPFLRGPKSGQGKLADLDSLDLTLVLSYVWHNAIIDDIMNRQKLKRLRRRLEALRSRQSNIKSGELERFAKTLGRKPFSRGKEPTFVSELLPKSRPLSIPHHSKALKRGTAGNILDQLEKDIDDLEELLLE